ncbi:YciI family protein [Mesorhizobium retamae]|uniref:YciI family protein n=1 Tax=Mesorhizobium retamae TaxID=2912854 RepID=A0ABS9QD34_9HYPH|nr:YciI family protein [Mesorhizobium sp. IRAMC:0171]MCG7505328.1 YciI family protein [Mesorhizobium sp. IRAMC:0171]
MTRFVAIFEDNVGFDWVRRDHSGEHLAFLEANKTRIVLAGALRPGVDEHPSGGLWIFDVASADEAIALIESDPYFKLGLRKSYDLRVWGKPPFYGAVTL